MNKIQMEKADPKFKYEVAARPGAENIKKCFSCGTCTSSCPVFRVENEYNPRRLIRMILLGLRKEVLSSKIIWLCARCYACTAHCPQGVSFADIMVVLRDMAIAEGYAQPDLPDKIEAITAAASEFRKDCIKILTSATDMTKKDVVAHARKAVSKL